MVSLFLRAENPIKRRGNKKERERGEKIKAKNRSKLSAAKLEEYLKEHPEMRGIE